MMKYYIELTVRREDPLTHYTSEDFIDLSCPWVDIDPATPAPHMWWETDSGKGENNDYYTLVVYTATDDGEPDFDNMVAGASMSAWDIWEAKNKISE